MENQEFLYRQNPHWRNKFVTGVRREIFPQVLKSVDNNLITTIIGPRRSGKSFLLHQTIAYLVKNQNIDPTRILYLNLESPQFIITQSLPQLDRSINEYLSLYPHQAKQKIYFIFDEIQNLPKWETWIRDFYERNKSTYKIFLTGSNSQLLSSELATKLTGRTLTYTIYPFSFPEYLNSQSITWQTAVEADEIFQANFDHRQELRHYFEQYLQTGTLPELTQINDPTQQIQYLTEYARAVIYKDIVPRFSLREGQQLESLLFYLVNNLGALFTYPKLASVVDSNEVTIKQYIHYLEQSFLAFICPKFDNKIKKILKSPKKVYLTDHGLRRIFSRKTFDDQSKLVENIVFQRLINLGYQPGYWNDKHELDFVAFHPLEQTLLLINVSYTSEPAEREFQAFTEFIVPGELSVQKIILSRDLLSQRDGIEIYPVWAWLLKPELTAKQSS